MGNLIQFYISETNDPIMAYVFNTKVGTRLFVS